jgi:hypothetical protein
MHGVVDVRSSLAQRAGANVASRRRDDTCDHVGVFQLERSQSQPQPQTDMNGLSISRWPERNGGQTDFWEIPTGAH